MGQRSWIKYLGLAAAFAGVASRVFTWLNSAQAPSGSGGEDITPEEITQLEGVITDAINSGLQGADIPILAQVTLISLE